MQFLDAERVQYSSQRRKAVAEGEVDSGPVEQIGQAGFLSRRQSAQCDSAARLRIVRALADQMVTLFVFSLFYFFYSIRQKRVRVKK